MHLTRRIAPCLWFDDTAEEAAQFYISVFRNSRIVSISRYTTAGQEIHHRPPGSVMVVAFELDGQPFSALNGGPVFTFNEAVSLQVYCDTQDEIDYYWNKLSAGGDLGAQQCGWLKDQYGVSWQVIPSMLPDLLKNHESPAAERVMGAILRMKKIDIAELQRAAGVEVAGTA
jgi:predicted 3-demethylubiquinone-9 3-methyltransferase (glyoxalase superfamily)